MIRDDLMLDMCYLFYHGGLNHAAGISLLGYLSCALRNLATLCKAAANLIDFPLFYESI